MTPEPAAVQPGTPLYRAAPWVLVRTPLLPASGRELARRPREALRDPEIVRALAIGSPTLLEGAMRTDRDERDTARVDRGLARYLIRMSTRPTPYGAFAAVSLARWAPCTRLELGERLATRTRPDMGWLAGLLGHLAARPEVRTARRWRADPLVHEAAGRLVASTGGSVKATSPAHEAIEAALRWTPYHDLVDDVCRRTGGTPDQVHGLLDQLATAGLLVPDLIPSLTGEGATSGRDALSLVAGADPSLADAVSALEDALRAADAAPPEEARHAFALVAETAGALWEQPDRFQTDLARELACDELGEQVAVESARAAETLLRLGPGPRGPADLGDYARAFLARYGIGRQVPLPELFDPVRGLGPMPHTHGGASGGDRVAQARRADLLNRLALQALRDGRRVVQLDPGSVDALATWTPSPGGRSAAGATQGAPLSLDLSVFVVAADAGAVDRGDFLVVVGPNLGAPSAGRWLGRFADMLGETAEASYRWLREAEQEVDPATDAEVVYLPAQARSANVVVRPTISPVEIVVSGRGSAAQTVGLDDLLVLHDGRRLHIVSRSLGVRLRPTARHMLNHHGAPAVCQFLDAVGRSSSVEFSGFDWGPAESLPVLPRVQVGRAVLAPARWLITVPDGGREAPVPATEFAAALDTARQQWGLPDRVYVTVADNRLLLDLTRPDDLEQLRREARAAGGPLRLQEALPDLEDAWVPGPGGGYLAELVVSLVRRPEPGGAPTEPPPATEVGTKATVASHAAGPALRLRLPGSDWLFAKFYAPFDSLNRLITDDLADLLDMSENSGLARRWFFVRYSDPEPHLRIRWNGEPDILVRHLLPQVTDFAEELARSGRISRLALDTYDREVERYGGAAGVALCEDVFHADSRLARQLLRVHGLDATELLVAAVPSLLRGLGLDADARLALYERQTRLADDPAVAREAGADYRVRKGRLREVLVSPPEPVAAAVRDVEESLRPVAEGLRALEQRGELRVDDLWPSLLHMHHNRLVGPGGPPGEPRLHHLLLRTERGLRLSGQRT